MPAERKACVCPRMLCLARSTNSRLAIKDGKQGKNKSFCNYKPSQENACPYRLALGQGHSLLGQPTRHAPTSLIQLPWPLTDLNDNTSPNLRHRVPVPGKATVSPFVRWLSPLMCEELGGRPSPFPKEIQKRLVGQRALPAFITA